MKKTILIISIVLLSGTYCLGQNEVYLIKELDILKPFVGKTWVSEDQNPSGQTALHFLMKLEPMHNGKILKIFNKCKELNIQTDGYYYYDSDKKEIAFVELSSNGNFAVGNVKEENGIILKYGYAIFPNLKLEFRNTLEFTSEGNIIDLFFSFEDGEWKAGHSRMYVIE